MIKSAIAAAIVLAAGLTVWGVAQDKKKPGYQDTWMEGDGEASFFTAG